VIRHLLHDPKTLSTGGLQLVVLLGADLRLTGRDEGGLGWVAAISSHLV
jgi:hypothetical protein